MTVDELVNRMGSSELTTWIAIDNEESFETRAQWPMALLACMTWNRYRKAGTAPAKPKDFLYGAKDETRERQTRMTFAALDAMAVDKKDGTDKT